MMRADMVKAKKELDKDKDRFVCIGCHTEYYFINGNFILGEHYCKCGSEIVVCSND